ncbi:ring-cleaving dioxygenase [Pelagovum pacificum]|uniref:Ring-cleaving dioxygenase n=1 Tax=Pelagovum pacificum TaxID=2588711 RepID=A0A5C5GGR3_9RHOB|nr:ring-cleaving dioxygenase [Pelagovum pacificum]QQA43107.1 ring-cleaving dioxygenase [Pelagovum pacificum]TNY33750.1 ring-cleaving dioxygenase [Pelagovum pacificum]
MLRQINGLHHVTSISSSAVENNAFFTDLLGLRRVKKTVNFDAPDVYHLYYGDGVGSPGTVMTYFPFPNAGRGKHGTGEVGLTRFAIPTGSAANWTDRLGTFGVEALEQVTTFGATELRFHGPDGDELALVEVDDDRTPWTKVLPDDMAIRGFHSVSLRLADTGPTAELLRFMGYEASETEGDVTRFVRPDGNAANVVDLEAAPGAPQARQGAGSVHHIAFSVDNRARQLEVREALADAGFQVTPVIDRDYFKAIYFRTPGGVLFEVATNDPGFDRDEDRDHLGEGLKLPSQHEHLRSELVKHLEPIDG